MQFCICSAVSPRWSGLRCATCRAGWGRSGDGAAAGKTTLIAPIAESLVAGLLAARRRCSSSSRSTSPASCAHGVRAHGELHQRSGHGAAVSDDQVAGGLAAAFMVNAAGDVIWMFAPVVRRPRAARLLPPHPLPAKYATDKILPYFISQTFPARCVGLVIAAILAASLSSVDSAINSCTSVMIVDFYYRRFCAAPGGSGDDVGEQRRQVLMSRDRDRGVRAGRHRPGDERVADRERCSKSPTS